MSPKAAKTTLYRLIEAGHLARQKILVPLQERGLEPGDDALLFSLTGPNGTTEVELRAITGLSAQALAARLDRLAASGLLVRCAAGPDLSPGARLTPKGSDIGDILEANWDELDRALTGELGHKEIKALRKILKRFAALLNL